MSSDAEQLTQSPTLPDPRPLLMQALDQTQRLVVETDRAAADLPTPCSEYDVDALIGHLLAVVRRAGVVLSGGAFESVPMELQSTDWAADWSTERATTDAVLPDVDLDVIVRVPWGEVPARAAAAMYAGELTTHAWDLAAATGRRDQLDDTLAVAVLPGYREALPADLRGEGIPFDPVVPTPDDAPPYDLLAAWVGRDPAWRP